MTQKKYSGSSATWKQISEQSSLPGRTRQRDGLRHGMLWLMLGFIGYAYAGYPVLLWLVACFRSRQVNKADCEPTLSIIIPAHNEERVLAEKLDSILGQNYPADKIEILVASDGSTDETNAIAQRYTVRGVRLLDFERQGKAKSLNQAAIESRNTILIFTDANAILAPGCLRALVRNFADSSVGGVSANEQRSGADSASAVGLGEQLYWEYDKWIKQMECRVGSMVSASGSLYAIRRELFRAIQDPAATDDFSISTNVVRCGYRLVFEPDAITLEPPIAKSEIEFNRRVRIITRGLRSVYGIRELLLPWNSGFYALQVWSHKIVRRLVGFFALVIFGLSLSLTHRRFVRVLLTGQVSLYGLALIGWLGRDHRWGRKRWFFVPYYFVLSNLAGMLGVIQFFRQRRLVIWEPRRDT